MKPSQQNRRATGAILAFPVMVALLSATACGGPPAAPSLRATLGGDHTIGVFAAAFSPDGKTLATAGETTLLPSGEVDNSVKLWDAAAGTRIATLEGHAGIIRCLAFSPDGKTLAAGYNVFRQEDRGSSIVGWEVKLWRVGGAKEIGVLKDKSLGLGALVFSSDGKTLAVAGGGWEANKPVGEVSLWDVKSGRNTARQRGPYMTTNGTAIAYMPDGQTLATVCGSATFWDLVADGKADVFQSEQRQSFVAVSENGRVLASSRPRTVEGRGKIIDGEIRIWDAVTREEIAVLEDGLGEIEKLAFSPDGKFLATSETLWHADRKEFTKCIRVWDATTGRRVSTLENGWGPVPVLAFTPDGATLATSGGLPGSTTGVKLWDWKAGRVKAYLGGHFAQVLGLAFSPDGKTLASASNDHTVWLWDAATGRGANVLRSVKDAPVYCVAFSPDGRLLASSQGAVVRLWDPVTGKETDELTGHTTGVTAVAFSPDGRTLASGSSGVVYQNDSPVVQPEEIILWDVATKKVRATLRGQTSTRCLAYSPDGKTLASGSHDKNIRLWDVATGKVVSTLEVPTERVQSVAFSPDGRTLASAGVKTLQLWDAATGKNIRTIEATGWEFSTLAFSPDGLLLAAANCALGPRPTRDTVMVKLWEVSTGKEIGAMKEQPWSVYSLAFSPDGKTLAAGDGRGAVRLWDVSSFAGAANK
ncbi:MAG TPA: hypothetical protein DDY78_00195 [Planctomycetales bacterium]|jgi:WD40 repeat protein|nr:hypothetical protein [Planctomycetales bacterium]